MNAKNLAAIVAVLPALVLVSPSDAAPVAQPKAAPTVAPTARPAAKVKALSALTMKNVGTVPGEKRTYEAVLKTRSSEAPLANKKVKFRITPKNGSVVPNGSITMGEDTTDAQGRARLEFSMPELAQANYTLEASFAGDDEATSDKVEANLLVIKATTKIELGNLIWGTYKNEPGTPYGTIGIRVIRTSDNQALSKPVKISVNGKTWTLQGNDSHFVVLQPMDANSWNVKVWFEGDDYAISSFGERGYQKPN